MTIKLLSAYGKYPWNAIVTLDAATEASLIAEGDATATLTGGVVWVDPNVSNVLRLTQPAIAAAQAAYIADPTNAFKGSVATRNTRALSRMLGAQSALVSESGLTAGVSVNSGWMGKWEAEAPFNRVRLWLFSKNPYGASRGWRFMVAPTETAAMDTQNNSFRPIVGGSAHNSYASIGRTWPVKGNDRYGWRKGTWGGAKSSSILYPGTSPVPCFQQFTTSKPIVSDWVDCPSVPRADGGTRPLMVFGISKDAFGTDSHSNYSASIAGVNGISLMSEGYKALTDGMPWGRLQLCAQTTLGGYNVVDDLTQAPANVSWLTAVQGSMPYLAWEFDFVDKVRSFWAVGDSQTEARHGTAGVGTYLLWWEMAVNSKSTPSAPIQAINVGMATNRAGNFRNQLFAMLQTGAKPTDLLFPNYSVNNSAPTANFTLEDIHQQIDDLISVITVCKNLGIKLYLWTNMNVDPGGTDQNGFTGNSAMAYLHAWTRAACAAGAATLVDLEKNFDRATMYIDGTHFNNIGDNYAAGVLSAVL